MFNSLRFLPVLSVLSLILLFPFACSRYEPGAQSAADEQAAPPSPPALESAPEADNRFSLAAKPPADAFITAVAALGNFGGKKFVRTADLKFRVSDALQATLSIENLAQRNGGFVTENNLTTELEFRNTQPVSRDSVVETTRLVKRNQLILRVPADKLDTTLREIGRLAEFLDYRHVKATDVALQLLEQELAQARLRDHQEQVGTAIQQSKKPESITGAADKLLDSRAAANRAQIEKLKLEDAIVYSTVQLDIYQRPQTQYVVLPQERPIAAFEPGFGAKLVGALSGSWVVLQVIILVIIRLWSVWLLLGLIWWGLRRRRKAVTV